MKANITFRSLNGSWHSNPSSLDGIDAIRVDGEVIQLSSKTDSILVMEIEALAAEMFLVYNDLPPVAKAKSIHLGQSLAKMRLRLLGNSKK